MQTEWIATGILGLAYEQGIRTCGR